MEFSRLQYWSGQPCNIAANVVIYSIELDPTMYWSTHYWHETHMLQVKHVNSYIKISSSRKALNLVIKVLLWSKITSFFSSDFESVFAQHLTGKILSFEFYPKAVYFECKFWISQSAITHIQNWPIGPQRVGSRENDVMWKPTSLKFHCVNTIYYIFKARV